MPNLTDLLEAKPPQMPDHPPCPFCNSTDTEFMSLFGQFLMVSQYYCRRCHSPFEWCRWQDRPERPDNAV
ncbi:MAG: hypothetical protein ACE5G8_01595 [Anaerolineae bacterium]